MLKRLLLVIAFLALLFGSVFGWKYWQARQQDASRADPPAAVVATSVLRRDSWQPTLRSVGSIIPTRGVLVPAEVAGVVRHIHFDSGQHVGAGELLIELDADVDIAELAALDAELRLAEITRERIARVVRDNLGSRSDLDEADATLDSARARLAAKEATIRKKSIRTPFAGELGIRRINPGQYLGPGDEIVPLVALDPIFAEYTLPERYVAAISLGQPVEVTVQAYPGRRFLGRIHAISPGIEEATRSVRVRALLDNPERLLRPGMFADVDTLLPQRDDVLTLPERAVTYNPYGDSVFVIEEANGQRTVRLVQIVTGEVRDGRVEVLSGLESGMEVVSDGHNKLRNGQPVTIDNAQNPDQPEADRQVADGAEPQT